MRSSPNTVDLRARLRTGRGPSTSADQAPDSKSTVLALARISHTFCDTGAIRSEKVSRCKSLTVAGQADPFRQSVFQPSAGRLMDIGLPPQSASVFRAKCSPLAQCEKCGLGKC